MEKNMSTKALSVVVATIVALLMVDIAAAVTFDWWNTSWHYRINVTINTSVYNRTDWPIEQSINFTALGVAGAFDNNSVRVIEYNGTTNATSEIMSQFDRGENYDKSANAYGEVIWLLNGTRPENTMLYYYIYFDSEDAGSKPPLNYSSTLVFYNFTFNDTLNFGLNNSKIAIRVDTERGANYTSGMYFAEVLGSGTVIFDSPWDQDPIEYIRYYDSPDYYGYNLTNSSEVISEGPIRIMVRQNGSEKQWGSGPTPVLTGKGYMTKTYTIYKDSQWITINQTFTSTDSGNIFRQSNGIEALAMDIDRTNMYPLPIPEANYYDENETDPYSWASVADNSMGLGVINLNDSKNLQGYFAGSSFGSYDLGIALSGVTINPKKSISELAAIYFNNVTSHDPVEALRNRTKDNVIITAGTAEERKTEVQAQTDYGIYNRNETLNITGNVTLDTHNLSYSANATITDPAGANTSINLTKSGSLFFGNYTLPIDAITGIWNLTIRVYDETDYLLNTSMTTFNVTDVYVVDILILNSPALVNQTMFANISVRTFRNDTGIPGISWPNLSCAYYNVTNVTDATDVTNITDSGFGNYSINWTAPEKGDWNLTCNATKYNNSGTGNATFTTIVKDTTLLNMTLTTTKYNVSGVTQTENRTFTATFNVTNLEQGYAYAVNVTLDSSNWSINIPNPYSCGDILPSELCIVDFNVTVLEKTTPGMYNITANVTWENSNGTKNSSFDWKNITVDSNPLLEIMQTSLNGTFEENSAGFLGKFTINATGNDDLGFVNISCISGVVCSDFNPVFTPANLSSLAAGSWTNVSVNITIPDGYPNGSYIGSVNASYGGVWDTVLLNVTVNVTKNWSAANVSSCYRRVIPNKSYEICDLEINNTGNVDMYFNITPPSNSTSLVNFTYSNETNFTVIANTTRIIRFYYNTTGATNQTISTEYIINATDPDAALDDESINVTLVIVFGPDIEFILSPTKSEQTGNITINATVTDRLGLGIDWVRANITKGDGGVEILNLTNTSANTPGEVSNWTAKFTNTSLRGNYTVVVYSTDIGGGYGESTEKNFTVFVKLDLSNIYPKASVYAPGDTVSFQFVLRDVYSSYNISGATVYVEVKDVNGTLADDEYTGTTTSSGTATPILRFQLGTDAEVGTYSWTAWINYSDTLGDENISNVTSGTFLVTETGEVSVTLDVQVVGGTFYPGDTVTVMATVIDQSNSYVSDANVTINVSSLSPYERVDEDLAVPHINGSNWYMVEFQLASNATAGQYSIDGVAVTTTSQDTATAPLVVNSAEGALTLDLSVGEIYKPGVTVPITGFVKNSLGQYITGANVTIKITDPDGNITEINATPNSGTSPPKYEANYSLDGDATLGSYIVFGEATYNSGYASDVELFEVSDTLFAKVSIPSTVYLNSTMTVSVIVINPLTGLGVDPDSISILIYSTQNSTFTLWRNLTKPDMASGDAGLFNYTETLSSTTPLGPYMALLEITEGSYKTWSMETFEIETGLFYDVIITNVTDPLTKGGDLEFTLNITNMGEFLSEDVVVSYRIDDGTVHSDSEPRAILQTGQSDILSKSFSGVNLPAGTHILYVSVGYDNVPIATASKTFQIVEGGGGVVVGGGGGGGGGPAPKGIPKLSIIEFYPPEVHVERGGVTYLVVTVENLGGADLHDVSAYITGIPEEWFDLIKGESIVLNSGEGSDILLQIKIPESVTAQTVILTMTATSREMSYEKSIILRIFSSRYDLVYFEIESVKKTLRKSEDRAFRALKGGKNVSMVMEKLDEARMEIRYAESFLDNKEYTKVLGHLDNTREVLEHVNELLELARVEEVAGPAPAETPASRGGISTPALVFIFLVIAALAGAVVYLARERIFIALKPIGTPTLNKAKFRRISPEVMVKSGQLKEDIRKVGRLIDTIKDQYEKGFLSDNTYKELKNRNEVKLKELNSKLKQLGT